MDDANSLFERAAEALQRAMNARSAPEQALMLEEALRLNRLALIDERYRLAKIGRPPRRAGPGTG